MKILATVFAICGGLWTALGQTNSATDAATNAVVISAEYINSLVAEARTNNPSLEAVRTWDDPMANADLARKQVEGFSGEVTECLDEISIASDRAAALTRQLLAFSRKQTMQSQPVHLDSIIMNLSKMLKRIVGEHIDLRSNSASVLPLVRADTSMLEQVLVNLVVNARDAMPDGGQLLITTEKITFEASPDSSHPEARAGDFACITVKDSGTGISPENLPRVFEPFFTTKEFGKGSGLGLATVYGIVKQHQGWIEVSSQVNSGTMFKTYLPALEGPLPISNKRTPKPADPGLGVRELEGVYESAVTETQTKLGIDIKNVLNECQTIKPGMTRAELSEVFETESGLSTPKHRTYVYRDCPYVKVDVDFTPSSEKQGTLEEKASDIIASISKPYLD
jgi:hypothetical protein